jgi:hypothetical protein
MKKAMPAVPETDLERMGKALIKIYFREFLYDFALKRSNCWGGL